MSISRRTLIASAVPLAAALVCGPARARSGRSAGTDPVQALRGKLRGDLYLPKEPLYDLARTGLGTTPVDDRFPAIVVVPDGADDIARAIDFARSRELALSVRSGGHDIFGASTASNGMLIDLARMNEVAFDPSSGLARAGAGARAGDLNFAGADHGVAPVLGMHPHIGLGGLTLGGGIGWLCGAHGAAVDHLDAVEMVTADGRTVRASARENTDLFWALRGGGGNFGIATSFTYRMQPVATVLAGTVRIQASTAAFLRFIRDFLAQSPDALDMIVTIPSADTPTASVTVCWSGEIAAGEKALHPLRTFGTVVKDTVRPQSYVDFANDVPTSGHDLLFWRGGEFDRISDAAIDAIAGIAEARIPSDCTISLLHYMHGALCRTPAGSTPLIRDEGHILYNIAAAWSGGDDPRTKRRWALDAVDALKAVNSSKVYVNYLSDEAPGAVRAAYGEHFERLQQIKRGYDPDNVFRSNRNISPGPSPSADSPPKMPT